ncbi:neprilysin-1-like [Ornithodoros turicata]|uniref:neprilysin-1-like n=1 Tax=Ornithodoros turicata TaxID=34597 RepID=UPI003139D21F
MSSGVTLEPCSTNHEPKERRNEGDTEHRATSEEPAGPRKSPKRVPSTTTTLSNTLRNLTVTGPPPVPTELLKKLRLCLGAVLFLLLLLLPALIVNLTGLFRSSGKETLSRKLLPCDDFYSYVCEGWTKETALSVHNQHMRDFIHALRRTLLEEVPLGRQSAAEMAARLYQSCDDATTRDHGGIEILREVWKDCETEWPKLSNKPDSLKTLVRLYNKFEMQNILNIQPYDNGDLTAPMMFLGSATAVYYDKRKLITDSTFGYKKYFESFRDLAKTSTMKDEEILSYEEFRKAEDVIYDSLVNYSRVAKPYMEAISLSRLADLTPEIPLERWLHLFQVELQIPNVTQVIIDDQNYIAAFSGLWRNLSETDIHGYITWFNLQQMAVFINSEFLLVSSGSPSNAEKVALDACLRRTEDFMGWAAYARYADKYIDNLTRIDVHDVMKNISFAASAVIRSALPLPAQDNVTSRAEGKLAAMFLYSDRFPSSSYLNPYYENFSNMNGEILHNWIGATESYRRTEEAAFDYTRFLFIPQAMHSTTYEFYSAQRNMWLIPPYAAMLPLYGNGLALPVIYGGFGYYTASAAVALYREGYPGVIPKATRCFGNGSGTDFVRRAMDYALSLLIAWEAYKKASAKSKDVRLVGHEKLSGNELFFIAHCFLLCESKPEIASLCNETLKLSEEFSKAFSCPSTSSMYSKRSC